MIRLTGMAKTYRTGEVDVQAVRGVSFEIARGEFVAIMGASGSGKSTLMNTLGCLDKPSAGDYLLAGVSVGDLSRKRLAMLRNRKLGFVFQNFNLLARTTALENVELPIFYSHPLVSLGTQRRRAIEALERVGLGARLSHHPSQLSGGQQQRIAIARALVNQPELVLADEPTGNLDSRTSAEIMGVFQELNEAGITLVLVTHEADVAAYCKRIIVMRDGEVLTDEPNSQRRLASAEVVARSRVESGAPRGESGALARVRSLILRPLLTGLVALRALRRNKLRSALTALGIIIGVASVVAMVAIGNGAQNSIEAKVAALGQNILIIFSGNRHTSGVNAGLGSAPTFTLADAIAIQREVPDIAAMSPEITTSTQAIANGRNWATTLAGESPEYLKIRDWKLATGSMFTDHDLRATAKVAVMGSKAASQLFGPLNPVGQTVRMNNIPFIIIGVLTSKGSGMGGQDQDDRLIVPYTTAMKRVTGDKYPRSVTLQISSQDRINIAQQQIVALLRQRHRLASGEQDDFSILNQKEIADTVGNISQIITIFLGSIAGMSLLVGGIGIMNIMLVSVTERTREIGIRMAVGAQGYDILLQFLIEAITLSLLGGLIGVLAGVSISRASHLFVGFNAVVSPGSVILAFTVSFAIGVFFGFYPARKAASLDPIEALRYE
jgi:macrolide transport system ATP-binding/permease protein